MSAAAAADRAVQRVAGVRKLAGAQRAAAVQKVAGVRKAAVVQRAAAVVPPLRAVPLGSSSKHALAVARGPRVSPDGRRVKRRAKRRARHRVRHRVRPGAKSARVPVPRVRPVPHAGRVSRALRALRARRAVHALADPSGRAAARAMRASIACCSWRNGHPRSAGRPLPSPALGLSAPWKWWVICCVCYTCRLTRIWWPTAMKSCRLTCTAPMKAA